MPHPYPHPPRLAATLLSLLIALCSTGCFLTDKFPSEVRLHNMTPANPITLQIPSTRPILLQPGQSQAIKISLLSRGMIIESNNQRFVFEQFPPLMGQSHRGMNTLNGKVGFHVNLYFSESGLLYADPSWNSPRFGPWPLHPTQSTSRPSDE